MRPCLPPDPAPHPPAIPAPAGTCDTHCHVIGPASRYPFSEPRSYTPPDGPVEAYLAVRETLGIARSVIVQPGAHGFDNTVTTDAIATIGNSARGIAVVPPDISDEALRDLDAKGIRGLRLSTLLSGGVGTENIARMAEKVAPLGWHILLHLKSADELPDLVPMIRDLPVDVVLDHMARVTGPEGVDSAPFRALLDLLTQTETCWTKVCSWYRLSGKCAPFDDMRPMAEAVLAARPDRVLWGTNWPHPLLFGGPVPNDGDLMDQIMAWAGSDAVRQAVLVDNPARLYGF
ncbi:amidohydrolase family protein [Amorphus coralli]|uniref:amidohydrolase family protein n=1 Tax=Amorphus coralli TaxID=340680 RepID=UPI0004768E46|nr:amidohydrolase family protein [Amorphus coralli]